MLSKQLHRRHRWVAPVVKSMEDHVLPSTAPTIPRFWGGSRNQVGFRYLGRRVVDKSANRLYICLWSKTVRCLENAPDTHYVWRLRSRAYWYYCYSFCSPYATVDAIAPEIPTINSLLLHSQRWKVWLLQLSGNHPTLHRWQSAFQCPAQQASTNHRWRNRLR